MDSLLVGNYIEGFPPIVSEHVKVLILGSMPSQASLVKQQYYAHQRNAFWPIMGSLFGAGPELVYQQRKEILLRKNIAVWDVLKACERIGSLDSDINRATVQSNDFYTLYLHYPTLQQVFFNGAVAETMYQKHVLPILKNQFPKIEYQRLPSTSPAHAAMNLQQKLSAWRVVAQCVVK